MITKAGINEPKWLSGRWWMEDISIIIIGEDGGHWRSPESKLWEAVLTKL